MTGTILNAIAIILGGLAGLVSRRQIPVRTQLTLKLVLGVLAVFVGLRLTFASVGGGFGLVIKQFVIIILAMTFGRLTGRGLGLQRSLNRLGQYAKQKVNSTKPDSPNRLSEGFISCSILYCMGPIAMIGAVQDGLSGHWPTLGIKAVMDGLATMAFISTFGWGVIVSAVPVAAYQGTLTLGAQYLAQALQEYPALIQSIHATSGILVFSIALIILEVKKIELADYLPSLIYAPLLTWLWP